MHACQHPNLSRYLLLFWAFVPLLAGCANVTIDGDTKVNTAPLWLIALIVLVCLAGAIGCWAFRKMSPWTWLGVVGLPLFALYIVIAVSQLKAIVDKEHFELRSLANNYNVAYKDLTHIEVVKVNSGVYRRGTEIVDYYIDLHKKNGEVQRITMGEVMKPLWKDVIQNAAAFDVKYDNKYGYY